MRLVIDFDSTVANTHKAVLDLYRHYTNDYSTDVDDKTEWNMQTVCKLWSKDRIQQVFGDKKLFEFMKPLDNAVEVLKKLSDRGHYIVICSLHRPEGIPYKIDWIEKYLPFIDEIDIVPVQETPVNLSKEHAYGDVQLDDNINCLRTSRCLLKVLYGNYSWNKDWKRLRVDNWLEFEELFNVIESDWQH